MSRNMQLPSQLCKMDVEDVQNPCIAYYDCVFSRGMDIEPCDFSLVYGQIYQWVLDRLPTLYVHLVQS